jgi:hypothetical protein
MRYYNVESRIEIQAQPVQHQTTRKVTHHKQHPSPCIQPYPSSPFSSSPPKQQQPSLPLAQTQKPNTPHPPPAPVLSPPFPHMHTSNSTPAAKTSRAIQAAECSHNTRTASQTFAVFTTDHQYDSVPGAPYGTCEAYACAPGSNMVAAKDKWTFFWTGAGAEGEEEGDGAGCIKSPDDGQCGCEGSDGVFVPGGTDCV